MTKEIITESEQIESLANSLGEASQKFYRHSLLSLVAYKIYVGRLITQSPLYKKYGENLIGRLVQESGLKETILYDCANMYVSEKLAPQKEKKFLKEFETKYESWTAYRREKLGLTSHRDGKSLTDGCLHCEIHCPKT